MVKCKFCQKNFNQRRKDQKFCSVICSNRFNLNNKRPVSLPKKYTKELAELFGILLGDGSLTKYYLKIYLNAIADKEYVPRVYVICRNLFPMARISCYVRLTRGTEEIQISSSDVTKYFTNIGFNPKVRSIPNWILENNVFSNATLRGLFDTEGTVGIKKFQGKRGVYIYAQLTFTNKNKNLLTFVEDHLKVSGYAPTEKSKKNIYISNVRDINRYMLEIGSSNPKFTKKLQQRITHRSWRGARAV